MYLYSPTQGEARALAALIHAYESIEPDYEDARLDYSASEALWYSYQAGDETSLLIALDELADEYSVYTSAHMPDFGWLHKTDAPALILDSIEEQLAALYNAYSSQDNAKMAALVHAFKPGAVYA